MIHPSLSNIALVGCWLALSGCVGTTGGELLELEAYAAGPLHENAGQSLRFTTSRGYDVELTRAQLFIGGVYLNRSRKASVSSDTSCALSGTYVAQLLSGLDVDLLSAEKQPFPELGFATSELAQTAEVWLSRGDIDGMADSAPILRVAGRASDGSATYSFEGALSIGQNRIRPATDQALPGAHPICKERIVSPIPVELTPAPGKELLLRIDPRGMFGNVEFSTLADADGTYRFSDQTGVNQASDNLYAGMRKSSGVYSFEWLSEGM